MRSARGTRAAVADLAKIVCALESATLQLCGHGHVCDQPHSAGGHAQRRNNSAISESVSIAKSFRAMALMLAEDGFVSRSPNWQNLHGKGVGTCSTEAIALLISSPISWLGILSLRTIFLSSHVAD